MVAANVTYILAKFGIPILGSIAFAYWVGVVLGGLDWPVWVAWPLGFAAAVLVAGLLIEFGEWLAEKIP